MKLKKVLASTLAAATVLSSAVLVNAEETITLTLWGAEEDQTLLGELVEEFKAAYPDVTFDIQIGVESESTAKDTILTDVEAAADVYSFASDQIYDLVNAGALIDLDEYAEALTMAGKTLDDVKAANVAGSIEAATVDGKLYAFPPQRTTATSCTMIPPFCPKRTLHPGTAFLRQQKRQAKRLA